MAFRKLWYFNVVDGGGLTSADIPKWIKAARIPAWFDFRYSPENCKWHTDCGEDYGCWPQPDYEWTFTVVRPGNITNGLHMKNAAGLGWEGRFCITADFADDPETLGLRLWHEALHSMGINSDMLNPSINPNDVDRFCDFVKGSTYFKNDSQCAAFVKSPHNHPPNAVLRAYYYMLMVKDLGCAQLPIPSAPVPATSLLERFMKWFMRLF